MRLISAGVCLAATVALGLAFAGLPQSIHSQQPRPERRPSAGQESPEPATGLFDRAGHASLYQGLNLEQQSALVALTSRYEFADSRCPLPFDEPQQVFYVKFRRPMGAAFAARLMDAGAGFVGYAALDTHFLRARDADALNVIGAVLRANPDVAGTVLRHPADSCTAEAWAMLKAPDFAGGDLRLLFFRDVTLEQAEGLLNQPGITILMADRLPDGRLDMDTPYLDVRVTAAAGRALINHPWLEMIEPHVPNHDENVASQTLVNATANLIGPGTPYNLTGEGLVAGVWDGGRARDTHVGLQAAYTGGPITNGTKRVLTGSIMSTDPAFAWVGFTGDSLGVSSHATHVTGTICGDGTTSSGGNGRGFAPRAYVVSVDWNNIDSERRLIRHHFRHVSDNHSYGNSGAGDGGYASSASVSDQDIRDIFIKMTKSAGNEGSGSNTVGSDKGIKNAFVIGAAEDNGTITSFSSRGPANDGRVTPHFMLNGDDLWSTDSGSNTHYSFKSGTSMSAPSANGSLVLLSELYSREYNRRELYPDVAKAVLAATTTEVYNTGPDYRYGYGIANIKRAADLILADRQSGGKHIVRAHARPQSVQDYEIEVTSGTTPLRVVLYWLDVHASASAAVTLINDIDMELIEPNGSTVHYPYSGLLQGSSGNQTYQFTNTGYNRRDNLEWAEIPNPAVGTWTVRITGFSIPSLPQATVLNDVVGYVLACERVIKSRVETVEDPLNTSAPVAIPDNSTAGVTRTFNVTTTQPVQGVRLYVDIKHVRRGDLTITLTHPDNTTVTLQGTGTSTRRDIIAVFPDTRQYHQDTAVFIGKPAAGTWSVKITDTANGNTGEIRYLALEVDFDPTPPNQPPLAHAGTTQVVFSNTQVQLDGSQSSDPDNDPLTFQWTQISGPAITIQNATSALATFTSPPVVVPTFMVFRVTVDDGRGGSDFADVNVVVDNPAAPNVPPVAVPGPSLVVTEGDPVVLDGSSSFDADGHPITFQWLQVSGPTIQMQNAVAAIANFNSPMVPATTDAVFQLTVSDPYGGVGNALVTVTILDNLPPVVDPGLDRTVDIKAVIALNGSGTQDPENDPMTYLWSQVSGTPVTINNANTVMANFVAPDIEDTLVFDLTVTDVRGNVASAILTLEVRIPPTPIIEKPRGKASGGGGCTAGGGAALWLLLAPLISRRRRRQ